MLNFSGKIEACIASPIRKFHPYMIAAEQAGRHVLHLNIGQPDIETPAAFFDAVQAYRENVLAYDASPGVPEFLEAVRDYYRALGFPIECENILATFGGSEALEMLLPSILDEGDEVLVPEPFYANYHTFVTAFGGVIRPIATSPENGYRYASREQIEPLITHRTKAIMITNPGNPTGVVLTHEEMRTIADIVKEHDLFLISDEVYREFVYAGQKLDSMLEFEDIAENTIVVDSVSKRFSACGARVGTLISRNRQLIAQVLKLCQSRLCAATLDQIGAAAMYRQVKEEYFDAVRKEYRSRRDAVCEELAKIPGVQFSRPEGAFYLMAKLPVDDTDKLQMFLLQEFEDAGETVMYAPGSGFYGNPEDGRSEIRIAYVKNCDYLRRAIQLLGKGIAAYNERKEV